MVTIDENRAFSTEGLKIRRKGQTGPGYGSMTPASDPGDFEEVTPAMLAAESGTAAGTSEAEYKARVAALIRERYTADDEFALAANRGDGDETHAAEWAAYQAYRAECKERARAGLSNPENTPGDE